MPADHMKEAPAIQRGFSGAKEAGLIKEGATLQVFDTGSVRTFGGAVSQRRSWFSRATLEMPAFLIRHPKHGLILFDTGLHPDMATRPTKKMGWFNHLIVPFKQERGRDLLTQLIASGVQPEAISWVVISHMHIDHAGMIDAFPNATVVIDRREWQAQKEKSERGKAWPDPDTRELEKKLKLRLVDLSSAPAFGSFEHSEDLFGDGSLRLVDLAGHTPGSLGARVELAGGPALLAGDAAWVLENLEPDALPLQAHIFDVAAYKRGLAMLRAAREQDPRLLILPGHDLSPLRKPRADIMLSR